MIAYSLTDVEFVFMDGPPIGQAGAKPIDSAAAKAFCMAEVKKVLGTADDAFLLKRFSDSSGVPYTIVAANDEAACQSFRGHLTGSLPPTVASDCPKGETCIPLGQYGHRILPGLFRQEPGNPPWTIEAKDEAGKPLLCFVACQFVVKRQPVLMT